LTVPLTSGRVLLQEGSVQDGDSLDLNQRVRSEGNELDQRAARAAGADSIERIYTDLAFAHQLHMDGQYAEAHALRLRALALARQHGDPEALFKYGFSVRLFNALPCATSWCRWTSPKRSPTYATTWHWLGGPIR
jgi:hypothetical protein